MTIRHIFKSLGSGGAGESSAVTAIPQESNWTDERIDLGKKLYAEGLSASQIAAELGGVTRNAVIGKAHRMGWQKKLAVPSQPATLRKRPRKGRGTGGFAGQYPRNTSQPEPYCSTLPFDDIPRQQRRTFFDLGERHCRWPCGDPGTPDFFFCGGIRKDPEVLIGRGGGPYCATHCAAAFIPAPRRRTPYVYRGPQI